MTDEIVRCTWPLLRLEALRRFSLEHVNGPADARIIECGEHFVTHEGSSALVLVQLGLAKVIDL